MDSAVSNTELIEIKVQLQTLVTAFNSMQSTLGQVVSMDKDLSLLNQRFSHLEGWIKDTQHADKTTRQMTVSVDDKLDEHITKHTALVNKLDGATRLGKIVYSAFLAAAVGFGTWVYDRAETNKSMNVHQEQAIALIQKDIDFLKSALLSTRNNVTGP